MPMKCNLCPNNCNTDRTLKTGACLADGKIRVAYSGLHMWEEPVISGTAGSGAVFFSGCTMRCVYCQNKKISRFPTGKAYTPEALAALFEELDNTAHNINLVSPTPYLEGIISALDIYKPSNPVIMNTGGYEKPETVKKLKGYVNVFLPDLKYVDSGISTALSGKSDYFKYAFDAISQMIEQTGKPVTEGGLIKSGVIVRHLIIPSYIENTLEVLRVFADNFKDKAYLSLMAQYTPVGVENLPRINRKITPLEYKRALAELGTLGIKNGFVQELSSADVSFIPDF